MKHSLNTPLTRAEIARLPLGFTPTSIGLTGQEIKRNSRLRRPHSNRKFTKAHPVQYVPIFTYDEDGNKVLDIYANPVVVSTRQVWHKNYGHIINKIPPTKDEDIS